MAALPTDIATSQAEALGESAPTTTPQAKPKKTNAKPPKISAVPASTNSGEGETAATDASTSTTEATPPVAKATPASSAPATQRKRNDATPWYVERSERTLRTRENQSFPILFKNLTLQTFHAQDILQRTGKNWSEAMITLSETMRNFKPEAQCIEVDAAVDRLLDESFAAIKANMERLKALSDTHGLDMDDVEAEYSKPSIYKLKVLSPREFRFHNLIQELDKLCALTDKMWYVTLVSDRNRSQIPYETKRQIIRMVNRVRTLVYRAQASSDRAGASVAVDPRVGTIVDPNAGKAAEGSTVDSTATAPNAGAAAIKTELPVAEVA